MVWGIFFSQKKKDHVRELFESRARAEDEAVSARTPRNRLHVSSLVALLEERQRDRVVGASGSSSSSTAAALSRQLAEKYGMDVERLEKLVRSVNVPSVREPLGGATVRDAESGEDIVVKEVSVFLLGGYLLGSNVDVHRTLSFFIRYRWSGRSQRILCDDGQLS
jgi:hypothetical protein